jgi:DNA-binding CsgD family transcriptional regulator
MARTLFFIEAILLLLSSALLSSFGTDRLPTFMVPAAASVLIPILSVSAVWPFGKVIRAFLHAFSRERPGEGAPESAAILEAIAGFSGLGALSGIIGAAIVLTGSFAAGEEPLDIAFHVMAFALFGVFYAMTARILRNVIHRTRVIPENGDVERGLANFAAKYGLSPRESEVAAEIVNGRSYQEAADALFISIKTVKTHVSHVYEKTGCPTKVALVLLLREEMRKSYERPMVGNEGSSEA